MMYLDHTMMMMMVMGQEAASDVPMGGMFTAALLSSRRRSFNSVDGILLLCSWQPEIWYMYQCRFRKCAYV